MLSGIGDTDHLNQVGVTPVHHLPQVGQNLQGYFRTYITIKSATSTIYILDHLIVFVPFDTTSALDMDVLASLWPDTWSQYMAGGGPMTSTGGCGGLAHVHTDINNDKVLVVE